MKEAGIAAGTRQKFCYIKGWLGVYRIVKDEGDGWTWVIKHDTSSPGVWQSLIRQRTDQKPYHQLKGHVHEGKDCPCIDETPHFERVPTSHIRVTERKEV